MGMGFEYRVLVTGVTGFIGARVVRHLGALGFFVFGVSRGWDENDDDGVSGDKVDSFIQGDFGNLEAMSAILSDIRPDIIIHCAGMTPHRDALDDDYHTVNYKKSLNLLQAISQCDWPIRLINTSTVGVYGWPLDVDGIVHEGDTCTPLSPYAQSKYDFENALSGQDVVPYINARIANIPGRDAFINYVAGNHKVEFYGDVPYVRDYIHLDDLCRFFEKSVTYLLNGGMSATLNAGAGIGHSFPDIVDEIERQLGASITRHNAPIKSGDVPRVICDITLAKQTLGWEPQQTDLQEIIDYALRHQQL